MNTGVSAENAVMLFKRGSKAAVIKDAEAAVGDDEEKEQVIAGRHIAEDATGDTDSNETAKTALLSQPKMQNVFSWQHLQYLVVANGENRRLLDDVSGYVAPGKLTALMGESGAGKVSYFPVNAIFVLSDAGFFQKTTLLNVLAERADGGQVHGERYFNGQALPPDFQAQTGYCQQTDTHVPTQTVREALQFSARLRQPVSVSVAEKDE